MVSFGWYAMAATITFFPVDNGDMTLIELESGRTILIDVNIRQAADDEDDDTPNVAQMLRDQLKKDSKSRYYVDAFVLSHPDEDHCRGLSRHFHLGAPDDHPGDDKILIREMWSSPLVFRRASKYHTLCDDAKAWNKEAKRRVQLVKEKKTLIDGNRILVLGEDENGKTDGLASVLVKVDEEILKVNGSNETSMSARLLAPLPKSDDDAEEDTLSKNNSSVILRFILSADGQADACRYLTGGDAEVAIWERMWERHESRVGWIDYDLMLTPHHCSWHSLSADSWSDKGEDAEISDDARSALSQALKGASLIASSKEIKDDKDDPPCIRAKREYEAIAKDAKGKFIWVGDKSPHPLEFVITNAGPRRKTNLTKAPATIGAGSIASTPLPHGD